MEQDVQHQIDDALLTAVSEGLRLAFQLNETDVLSAISAGVEDAMSRAIGESVYPAIIEGVRKALAPSYRNDIIDAIERGAKDALKGQR